MNTCLAALAQTTTGKKKMGIRPSIRRTHDKQTDSSERRNVREPGTVK